MKLSNNNKQKYLFGLIIDPIVLIISSLVVLTGLISMIYKLSTEAIFLHLFICFSLVIMTRILGSVYKQDWTKLPLNGIVRLFIAEYVACVVHYAIQRPLHIEEVSFGHLLIIASIDFIFILLARIIFYTIERKKESDNLLLSSPTMHAEEQKYIQEAFDQNWIAPLGFNCDGFEKEMLEYLNDDSCNAFATVSGTSAIHLAVKLAGVKPGDIVLCSDVTFAATVNPVLYEGGIPVFIDSEYKTWNMDPELLEQAFEKYPQAKVVDLVHLYGVPAQIDKIKAICDEHNAILIEDSAEALGARYQDKHCGTFGDYNVLSFNGNKIITTSGGGMLLTKNKESRDKAMFWATQAREKAPWYQHNEVGYNYRMSNVIAGIGRGQLKHLDNHKALKEAIYKRYSDGFKGLPISMNPYSEISEPNFWLSCLLIDKDYMCKCERTCNSTSWEHEAGKTCPDEIAKLLLENKIETRPIWKPMHCQPIFANNDFITKEHVGEDIFNRGICLPSDIKMTKEAQDKVISIIQSAFNN